jgi:hypothetical protein
MDMKKILQAMDGVSSKPVEGSNDMKKFLQVVTEGANPHKVALPVQMAMQHYQQPEVKAEPKTRLIDKYFVEAEEAFIKQKEEKRNLINQYASVIAERVMMKESGEAGWGRTGMAGVGMQPIDEMPIDMTGDPNDPTVYGHEKANPMSLKGRIQQARAQLKELAELADRNDLLAWEEICKKAKGGMFMGLEQNLEQIRHGISELAKKRKQGGVASRGIDKNIGEGLKDPKDNPCWKGYKPVGTKKKGGKTVPNCVPKE